MVGIAYGYHDDTAQVIGHSQRSQEYLEACGAPLAEDAQHTQRECDVGGHRYRHASFHDGVLGAYHIKHDDRHEHAAACADDGSKRLLYRRQLTAQHLALDLQTHAQEEDCHEEVTDEIAQRHGMAAMAEQIEPAYAQAYGHLPDVAVGVPPGAVGHDKSRHGGYYQQHAAAHILLQHTNKCVVLTRFQFHTLLLLLYYTIFFCFVLR